MNGFQIGWRGIRSHDATRTTGKNSANSTVGKSIGVGVFAGGAGSGAEELGWPDLTRGRVYKRARQGLSALAGAAVLFLAAAPSAGAACEKTYSYDAKKDANYGKPPLIIGDSTMVYAAPLLAKRGF